MSEQRRDALPDADALVREIMERDMIEPAYALLVVRGLIQQLPVDDALSLIGQKPKPKPSTTPPDVSTLIG